MLASKLLFKGQAPPVAGFATLLRQRYFRRSKLSIDDKGRFVRIAVKAPRLKS